jgi:hypothetical protein
MTTSPPSNPPSSTSSNWLTTLYNSIPSVSVPGTQTAAQISETAAKLQAVVDNPRGFATQFAHGVFDALQSKSSENTSQSTENEPPSSSLSSRISEIVANGVSAVSVFFMEKLLQHSETHALDEKDIDLKKTSIQRLQEAQKSQTHVREIAQDVWNGINNYHIVFGGINLNVKPSTNETMQQKRVQSDGPNSDGLSPILHLVHSQEKWRSLRTSHDLRYAPSATPPSTTVLPKHEQRLTEEETQKILTLRDKTNQLVTSFAQKTVYYATMYSIDRFFNNTCNTNDYKQLLENENSRIEDAYLARFQGPVRKVLYRAAFRVIEWLIRPMIAETIEQVVKHLRSFFDNDVDLLRFYEKKIGDLVEYMGRLEKARTDYCQPNRSDEYGTFTSFLNGTIQVYGENKFSEKQLVKLFYDYIVDNFVSRPEIKLFGHRIPLVSHVLEWIIHSIRQAIVRHVLTKTAIIQKVLTQGSEGVRHVELAIKRFVEQQLTRALEMIHRSRAREVTPQGPLQTGKHPFNLEVRKTQLISAQFHSLVQQHSNKLFRCIVIESCNGDNKKLAAVDNQVSAFVTETIKAVGQFTKMEFPSISQVLEDASTNLLETTILTLFDDKTIQLEEHLQSIFKVLNTGFKYEPGGNLYEAEKQMLRELEDVDRNISSLQEQLSRLSISTTLEATLKNVNGEKHNTITTYVEEEKKRYVRLINDLERLRLTLVPNSSSQAEQLKGIVAEMTYQVEQYLSHISAQLPSRNLETCYNGTRGDLHNIYAAAMSQLNQLREQLEKIASAIDESAAAEEELYATDQCNQLLLQCPFEGSLQNIRDWCAQLQVKLPRTPKNELCSVLTSLEEKRRQMELTQTNLENFDKRAKLQAEISRVETKQNLLTDAAKKLNELKLKSEELENLTGSNRRAASNAIGRQYQDLMEIQDNDFKLQVVPLLTVKNTKELYRVFHPSLFATRVPIFSNLANIQTHCRNEFQQLRTEISRLPLPPLPLENRDEMVQKQTEYQKDMQQYVQQLRERLDENAVIQQKIRQQQHQQISAIQSSPFLAILNSLKEISSHFSVKGCISVGELKFYNTFAPEIIARVTPIIIDAARTLLNACGKPFHHKQLLYRLVVLDLADRQAAATA